MVMVAGQGSTRTARSAANALRCSAWLLASSALLLAQQDPAKEPADPDKVKAAVERWLTSDQTSREMLEATVAAVLAQPAPGVDLLGAKWPGLQWLGEQLPAAAAAPARPRSKGLQALATHAALEFVKRQQASGVFFAGQYLPLLALQPFVGDLFFGLLLDTPEWYPDTHRVQLVPALRDLQPTPPTAVLQERIVALADDAAIEPENLRLALSCLLWQWGRKQHAQARIDALQQASTEGDAEDRVPVMLELADLHYQLREYRASASTHRSLQSLAEAAGVPLKPNDYYAAACVHALAGNLEPGVAALEKCARLQADPQVDSSLKLKRTLFETDPEIATLRRDPRFAEILRRAFGPAAPAVEKRGH